MVSRKTTQDRFDCMCCIMKKRRNGDYGNEEDGIKFDNDKSRGGG
jgi:hypothetical protein